MSSYQRVFSTSNFYEIKRISFIIVNKISAFAFGRNAFSLRLKTVALETASADSSNQKIENHSWFSCQPEQISQTESAFTSSWCHHFLGIGE